MLRDNEADDVLVEEDSVPSLRQLFDAYKQPESTLMQRAPTTTCSVIGEVIDTHHPDLRGLIFVRWMTETGESSERWLKRVRGPMPRKGDRVLLEQPVNWPEKLIIAVLDDPACGERVVENAEAGQTLELQQNQCVRITDAHQNPIVELYSSSQGPIVRLMNANVNLEVPGKLRFQADTIELEAGRGGVDIRTDADTVVRSRFIRLN